MQPDISSTTKFETFRNIYTRKAQRHLCNPIQDTSDPVYGLFVQFVPIFEPNHVSWILAVDWFLSCY